MEELHGPGAAAIAGWEIPGFPPEDLNMISCLKERENRQVFLLRNRQDDALYVLKTAPAEDMPRLLQEYALMQALHDVAFPHPVACFQRGDRACLLREYVAGRTLAEQVQSEGPFPPRRALEIASRACGIVGILQSLTPPVVHRDIKPQNLILDEKGGLHLIDLDTAQASRPEKAFDTMVVGTERTAAPEQFGFRRCDERTDVYAIGILMVFLLTGGYDEAALDSVRLPPSLKRILRKCLAFDPSRRPASAKRLAAMLTAWKRRWSTRIKRAAAITAALAAVLIFTQYGRPLVRYATSAYTLAVEPEYTFASPLIEKAVRLQLGREGGKITWRDLQSVSELYLCAETPYKSWGDLESNGGNKQMLSGTPHDEYARLEDLSDLKNMPNLQKLGLNRLGLKDLTAFSGLALTHLGVGSNSISDLTPILDMQTLRALDISDNPLYGLNGLERLTQLRTLNITALPVRSLAPLAQLHLVGLDMYDVFQSLDCSALAQMEGLEYFNTRYLSPEGYAALCHLTTPKYVNLLYSGIERIDPLLGMKQISLLTLRGNPIKDLKPIASFFRLRQLDLSECELTSIEPLRGNRSVETLNIAHNPLTSLSALASMPRLKTVGLSEDQQPLLDALPGELPFSVVYIGW